MAKEAEFFDVKRRIALLEELKQQEVAPNEAPTRREDGTSRAELQAVTTKEPPRSGPINSDSWNGWAPWILGGLGLAAVGYYVYINTALDGSSGGVRPKPQVKPAAKPALSRPVEQEGGNLPKPADIFSME